MNQLFMIKVILELVTVLGIVAGPALWEGHFPCQVGVVFSFKWKKAAVASSSQLKAGFHDAQQY